MDDIGHGIGHALSLAGTMTWQVTWSLILGFTLSAIVEALVHKSTIVRLLPDDRPRSLATAAGLGAASSSCSYAAVALARSLFRKGADFTSAMAFQFASTNLVVELGLIMAVLLGWRFTAAEFVGGPVMIIVLALVFRRLLTRRMVTTARAQADRAIAGSMEGHAAMDMSVGGDGSFWRRLVSPDGFTSVSHNFVMEWAAVLRDLAAGLLIAGAAAAWIPDDFWQHLFVTDHPLVAKIVGPLIGPLIAVMTFVCSIGNVPLAAVLWNGGISFGGVTAFIFADLIIIPIVLIYRKYYGARMAFFLAGTFYVTMAIAGYIVEIFFGTLQLTPTGARNADFGADGISWNYTSWLNVAFLILAAVLVWRFFATGGRPMLAMMGGGPDDMDAHEDHAHHVASGGSRQADAGSLPLTGERTVPGIAAENYWFRRHEAAYEFAGAHVAGKRVLEVGCGEGYGADLLASSAAKVVGIDYDALTIAHCASTYPSTSFVRANLAALPIASESVDVVATLQVIEHVWNHGEFVRECLRVLRPGGLLLVTTPNRLTFSPGSDQPVNPFHTKEFTAAELTDLLTRNGFAIESVLGLHAGPRLTELDERYGSFVEAQLTVAPDDWPEQLAGEVTAVRTDDFVVVGAGRDVDVSLDLVVLARRLG